jgi:hypothetical protein
MILSDGDLVTTANLMGNTPMVAGANYPSMNAARQAEAAGFMNEDYIAMMRNSSRSSANGGEERKPLKVVDIKPARELSTATPVAGCTDAIEGEHAPKNGNMCDRFVMCLFCSSFAIVGTVDELWRLFSFQSYARDELAYLEERLGPNVDVAEQFMTLLELRDRYRLAIPYIDSFTAQQFAASCVSRARQKTAISLHPFWDVQMQVTKRARLQSLSLIDRQAPSVQ